ncbi:MAG: DUF4922 domain-containing protein [Gammaproteobacteria bacterium]|nr:DUF4922 domain-containing protein [Gammaproteobacteria bacterium]
MHVNNIDNKEYETLWASLNQRLGAIETQHGLGAALQALHNQQCAAGFVRDDLGALNRFRFDHPHDEGRFFSVQYNPRRAQRYAGAGRSEPPQGWESVNGGCFLCRDNIAWQQCGIELGYDIRTGGNDYFAVMNPYPLMPCHTVLVAQQHVPQAWLFSNPPCDMRRTVHDLLSLAERLPGFVGFYNGQGAGASISGHLHFQFFRRPEGYGLFALESATRLPVNPGYPLNALHWRGDAQQVADQASDWLSRWVERLPPGAQPSANIIATVAEPASQVQVFVVPRDQQRTHAPGMSGAVGGLEVLGELVFSTEQEWDQLQRRQIDYFTIENMLSAVSVPD